MHMPGREGFLRGNGVEVENPPVQLVLTQPFTSSPVEGGNGLSSAVLDIHLHT